MLYHLKNKLFFNKNQKKKLNNVIIKKFTNFLILLFHSNQNRTYKELLIKRNAQQSSVFCLNI